MDWKYRLPSVLTGLLYQQIGEHILWNEDGRGGQEMQCRVVFSFSQPSQSTGIPGEQIGQLKQLLHKEIPGTRWINWLSRHGEQRNQTYQAAKAGHWLKEFLAWDQKWGSGGKKWIDSYLPFYMFFLGNASPSPINLEGLLILSCYTTTYHCIFSGYYYYYYYW